MKIARAIRKRGFTHSVEIRQGDHVITADESRKDGGNDEGPSPQELLAASLASCSAITLEMYADRKGWNIGDVRVQVTYEPAQRGSPTRFEMTVKLPKELSVRASIELLHDAAATLGEGALQLFGQGQRRLRRLQQEQLFKEESAAPDQSSQPTDDQVAAAIDQEMLQEA